MESSDCLASKDQAEIIFIHRYHNNLDCMQFSVVLIYRLLPGNGRIRVTPIRFSDLLVKVVSALHAQHKSLHSLDMNITRA